MKKRDARILHAICILTILSLCGGIYSRRGDKAEDALQADIRESYKWTIENSKHQAKSFIDELERTEKDYPYPAFSEALSTVKTLNTLGDDVIFSIMACAEDPSVSNGHALLKSANRYFTYQAEVLKQSARYKEESEKNSKENQVKILLISESLRKGESRFSSNTILENAFSFAVNRQSSLFLAANLGCVIDLVFDPFFVAVATNPVNPGPQDSLSIDVCMGKSCRLLKLNSHISLNGTHLTEKDHEFSTELKFDKPGIYPLQLACSLWAEGVDTVSAEKTYFIRIRN